MIEFHDGHVRSVSSRPPRWSEVYGAGRWEQEELDKALATIARDPSKRPQPQIDYIEEGSVIATILKRADGVCDDRRARYCHGLVRAIEISQVARVLHAQRPAVHEDVAYWQGVGFRISWRKGTNELLGISPGLVEPFLYNGEFGLVNPLWRTSIMGTSAIASGGSLARELALLGVFVDAAALDEVLDAGLRQELLDTAIEELA
jgi:hypothetical protein